VGAYRGVTGLVLPAVVMVLIGTGGDVRYGMFEARGLSAPSGQTCSRAKGRFAAAPPEFPLVCVGGVQALESQLAEHPY
jgi:hypothetical protein